ncbi:unnamed protein product [Heligmosomoides polygyrus]|uniref:ZP domain-containing protein n=1 Tax=Heligmosomoides polygyrus TaxID=6339 RepID=A0A183FU35_HELPZ|nr:unnamed protein product [Heligmosomoides polygyrus]
MLTFNIDGYRHGTQIITTFQHNCHPLHRQQAINCSASKSTSDGCMSSTSGARVLAVNAVGNPPVELKTDSICSSDSERTKKD